MTARGEENKCGMDLQDEEKKQEKSELYARRIICEVKNECMRDVPRLEKCTGQWRMIYGMR